MQSSMQKVSSAARETMHCLGILGGTLLYALGMNLFVVPAGLYTGGIMGLSQLLRTFLLRATDLLVDEITLQCGYQSTPFFTSAFHRHFGLPPGQYRLKHKK